MIRSLLAFLLAETALLSAGPAWASTGQVFRWESDNVPILDKTLAAGTTRYTNPLSLADGEHFRVLGSWSGADSVSVTIEASSDQENWYTILDLPLVSDFRNGDFAIYVGFLCERFPSTCGGDNARADRGFWRRSANWVRLIVSNDADPTQLGNGTCTHLTLSWHSSDGPDPDGLYGPAVPANVPVMVLRPSSAHI